MMVCPHCRACWRRIDYSEVLSACSLTYSARMVLDDVTGAACAQVPLPALRPSRASDTSNAHGASIFFFLEICMLSPGASMRSRFKRVSQNNAHIISPVYLVFLLFNYFNLNWLTIVMSGTACNGQDLQLVWGILKASIFIFCLHNPKIRKRKVITGETFIRSHIENNAPTEYSPDPSTCTGHRVIIRKFPLYLRLAPL